MTEFNNNEALVVQIDIICEDKHSYLQQNVCVRIEGSYAVIFQALFERIMMFRWEVMRMSCDFKTKMD